jgi:hypothetical protein
MAKHLRSGYGILPHIAEDQVRYQDIYLQWQDVNLEIAIIPSQVSGKGCERNEYLEYDVDPEKICVDVFDEVENPLMPVPTHS